MILIRMRKLIVPIVRNNRAEGINLARVHKNVYDKLLPTVNVVTPTKSEANWLRTFPLWDNPVGLLRVRGMVREIIYTSNQKRS
jgi:hypothetical protein